MLLSRRSVTASLLAGLALPRLGHAQVPAGDVADVRAAIAGLSQLHTLLIQQGDDVVFAASPRGAGPDRAANIKSCSKSVLALVLGGVIGAGKIRLESRLGDVAPRLIPSDATKGVADLTMADLVTLRAGLAGTSGPDYGAWVGSGNWIAHALRRPMLDQPGGRMIYSTGTTHVLGAALAVATGDSLLTLARRHLGGPLDIDIPAWTRDPQGYYLGGNEMAMTPRAMLRIATLMRDQGRYGGRQVMDVDWIKASLVPRTISPYSGLQYGYGWFLSDSGYVIARGYGGQMIAAHPQRGLAVAITSDPRQPAYSHGYFGDLMRLLEGPILALGTAPA